MTEHKKNVRFEIASKDIISLFDTLDTKIFTYLAISAILNENREFWRLTKSLSLENFIQLLLAKTLLKEYVFVFPHRTFTLFSWGDVSMFSLVNHLHKDAYFSHYSAAFLHNLTGQIPKTIYLNVEQGAKNIRKAPLLQENIDKAFSRKQRETNNTADWSGYKICILNGKFTNKLGVIQIETGTKDKIFVTNIERTLIDMTVRPVYSGGVFEILNAFKRAKDTVSVNKLVATLKKLDYTYPYHQAIGFYLEKSQCYNETQVGLVKKIPQAHDFYLAHNMQETEYSKEWRLYYPKGF